MAMYDGPVRSSPNDLLRFVSSRNAKIWKFRCRFKFIQGINFLFKRRGDRYFRGRQRGRGRGLRGLRGLGGGRGWRRGQLCRGRGRRGEGRRGEGSRGQGCSVQLLPRSEVRRGLKRQKRRTPTGTGVGFGGRLQRSGCFGDTATSLQFGRPHRPAKSAGATHEFSRRSGIVGHLSGDGVETTNLKTHIWRTNFLPFSFAHFWCGWSFFRAWRYLIFFLRR